MDVIKKIFLVGLFLMPFFQGLYFYHEIFTAMSILFLLLIAICIVQKGLHFEKSETTLFLLSLALLYGITCFYAIDQGMAFIGALKILSYLLFYIVYTQLYTEEYKEQILTVLIYSCVIAAVLGILAFLVPQLNELFIQKSRLGGIFQYANTYGLYCLMGILFIIRRPGNAFLTVLGLALLVFATVLTFSRSILIIGLVVILLGILFERKQIILHSMGVGSGAILAYTFMKVFDLTTIGSRLADTSLQTSEWVIRLVYYKDALKMIAQFPFGTGYMGYSFIERAYQTSSTYQVKFVHSHILQYALDIGVIGALICCLFFFKQLINKKMDRMLKLIFITVAAHGLIDFDFEFPVIIMIMLLIIGIDEEKKRWLKKGKGILLGVIISLLSICLYMIVPTTLAYEGHYAKAGEFYPYYTEANIKGLNQSREYSEENYRLAQGIILQNQYQVEAFAFLRDYYFEKNDYTWATTYAQRTMDLNPLNIKHVEIYSSILIEYSQEAINEGNERLAENCFILLGDVPEYLEKLAKERVTDYNIRHAPKLEMTDVLISNLKKANQMSLELKKDKISQ